jgi:hypothetical protein
VRLGIVPGIVVWISRCWSKYFQVVTGATGGVINGTASDGSIIIRPTSSNNETKKIPGKEENVGTNRFLSTSYKTKSAEFKHFQGFVLKDSLLVRKK